MDRQTSIDKATILQNCTLGSDCSVLDIGCGVGRLSGFFSESCKEVVAFDYIKDLINIARRENARDNITYAVSACEDFLVHKTFDIIVSSGVFAYLNSEEVDKTVSNIKKMSNPTSTVILREPISLGNTFMIEKYSEKLEDIYSAVYRNIDEYNDTMLRYGYRLVKNVKLYQKNDENYIGMIFYSV